MSNKKPSNEEIEEHFNKLRKDQRIILQQLSKLESEKSEHQTVIEALKEVDVNRTCFRLVGEVLIERSVAEVIPALENNLKQLTACGETLKHQLNEKDKSIYKFCEQHKILRTEVPDATNTNTEKADGDKASTSGAGVLVTSAFA